MIASHITQQAIMGTDKLHKVLGLVIENDVRQRMVAQTQIDGRSLQRSSKRKYIPPASMAYLRLILNKMYPSVLYEWLALMVEQDYQPQFEVIELLTQSFLDRNAYLKIYKLQSIKGLLGTKGTQIAHTIIDVADVSEAERKKAYILLATTKEGVSRPFQFESEALRILADSTSTFRQIRPALVRIKPVWTPTLTRRFFDRCLDITTDDAAAFTEHLPTIAARLALWVGTDPLEIFIDQFIQGAAEMSDSHTAMRRVYCGRIAQGIVKFRRQMVIAIESGH